MKPSIADCVSHGLYEHFDPTSTKSNVDALALFTPTYSATIKISTANRLSSVEIVDAIATTLTTQMAIADARNILIPGWSSRTSPLQASYSASACSSKRP
ncbi:hypothetical protein [Altericista sp. CCNU0014]|uniref:hypothetical protein n=1 Tax=Altericista sp. CCNU0014 TaxID=3082949 RepID=UPI00384FD1F9